MPVAAENVNANGIRKKRDLPAYQLQAIESIPGWQWNPAEEGFETKIDILKEYLTDTGKTVRMSTSARSLVITRLVPG